MIKATMKELRKAGLNLNKIWLALHALRAEIVQVISSGSTTNAEAAGEKSLTFPDPLPSSASAPATRSLRSDRDSTDMINVFHPSQMIPVIISLVHTVLETTIIREDLDQGLKNHKDYSRDAKEAMKLENERWEKQRKTIEVGAKDKAQKAEVCLDATVMFSGSRFAPEPWQAHCTQDPDDQHRECIEDNWVEPPTTVYNPRYRQ
jgi:hypothetical protein